MANRSKYDLNPNLLEWNSFIVLWKCLFRVCNFKIFLKTRTNGPLLKQSVTLFKPSPYVQMCGHCNSCVCSQHKQSLTYINVFSKPRLQTLCIYYFFLTLVHTAVSAVIHVALPLTYTVPSLQLQIHFETPMEIFSNTALNVNKKILSNNKLMQLSFKGFAFYYNLLSQTSTGWIRYEIRGRSTREWIADSSEFAANSFGHMIIVILHIYI